jgi:protein disulfide-isomerase A1
MAAIVEQEKGMALITRYTVGPAEEFMNKPHTHEKLQKYIDKFLAGGLPPYIQSQDPAEHDPETSIQSVVGSNFDELVLNSKKNVVVFFHRDGCKHCQATHPVLEKVAATFSNNEEVVFLQFETFLNDLRNKAIGKLASVPAIYMFPANQKDQPVLYNGGRTSQEAMEKWVRDKAPSEQESDL